MSTPHRCPVCGGSGQVPPWFYNRFEGGSTTCVPTPDMCRSCGGTGVLWEPGGEAERQGKVTVTLNGKVFGREEFEKRIEEIVRKKTQEMGMVSAAKSAPAPPVPPIRLEPQ